MLSALLGLVLLLLLAGACGVVRRAWADWIYWASAALCAAAAVIALVFLVSRAAAPESLVLPVGVPWIAAHFRLDALAAWFILVIDLAGAAAAVYAVGYGPHNDEPGRVVPFFPVFLAAMNLVLVADDAFAFLVSWEFMSLSSWLLVLSNHRRAGNARAAQVYLVMAVLGTACLLLAFGIMAGPQGAYSFAAMREHPASGALGGLALALIVLGAGSKAGLVPLHAWLPLAHPAAPSHVSALMSGAMTKVALYGLVRVLFDLAGPVEWGWGAALVALGALSAVVGILHALMERDLKTLLAYSTVENIGVAVMAFGLAIVFKTNALPALAALALAAAFLHVLNHAVMKSLMFFVAGAVETATHERDLDKLGGLIHRLPLTAALALVGSASIAALPPLNGFVSEWLTFQAVLNSPVLPQWVLKFGVPLAGALLALSAALAAACFVRAYGIAFLGRPRSPAAAQATEVAPPMRWAMAALAGLCVAFGVLPMAALAVMAPVVRAFAGADFAPLADGVTLGGFILLAPLTAGVSSYSGVVVLVAVTAVTLAVVEGVHRLASDKVRRAAPWDCGFPDPTPAAQYTASSFAQPLRRVFGTTMFRAREQVDMPEPGDGRPARFVVTMRDLAWDGLYAPVERFISWLTDRFNPLQYLTIRRYLVFMFTALIVLLVTVALVK
jgi:formate hydrogenlyase subunit 3/multisubunit Na+/H+ antiporter MnhD subunit